MLNSLYSPVYNWVKNVYSLCVSRGVSGDSLYTPFAMQTPYAQQIGVQPLTFTHFVASFAPVSYTAFFTQFNLLITHLCTLSTAPTITKTKEK